MTVATKAEQRKLLGTLSELGGGQASDDDLLFSGSKLVIPEAWSPRKAIQVIQRYQELQETETRFSRDYRFRPWDGAAAVARALKRVTGFSGLPKAIRSFFGSQPPSLMTVPTGVDSTIQVPWGMIEIPLFDGELYLGNYVDEEYGMLFRVTIDAPRKYAAAIEGFFKVVQDELESESIYRGKAFNGAEMPEFLDLSGVDRSKVIYSDPVEEQLEANVWAMLRHTEAMRRNDVPLKRSILLHGPYGTGKTLGGFLTAQVAVENGWTFIQCRPSKDDIYAAMSTARLYQPAVVFFEDIDTVAEGTEHRHDSIAQLLDVFDGINSKGTEILAILTTNHPERIHKGMVRPGRLDAIIEIAHLDEGGVTRMVHSKVPDSQLGEVDFDVVANAMEGYLPAFVAEAIDRAKRYAIARTGDDPSELTTVDFKAAADGLRPQYDLMSGAGEGSTLPTLDAAIIETVHRAVTEDVLVHLPEHDPGKLRSARNDRS